MEPLISPINGPVSLEKLAYDALKEAILTFRLKPGQSLVENDLARQLNISKTPVRDALVKLEKEGFVVKVPYTGTYVAGVTRQAVSELFQIRAALEGLAASIATPLVTDEEIDEMQKVIDEHKQVVCCGNIQDAASLNRKFHEWILRTANNERLDQILANLEDHIRRYRILSNFQSGRLDKSVEEHQAVLDAIRRRDADGAEKALRKHLLSVRDDLAHEDLDNIIAKINQGS